MVWSNYRTMTVVVGSLQVPTPHCLSVDYEVFFQWLNCSNIAIIRDSSILFWQTYWEPYYQYGQETWLKKKWWEYKYRMQLTGHPGTISGEWLPWPSCGCILYLLSETILSRPLFFWKSTNKWSRTWESIGFVMEGACAHMHVNFGSAKHDLYEDSSKYTW